MSRAKATRVVARLQDAGYDARLYDEYSGRGMYGETTVGVSTEARPNEHKATAGLRCDNLGRGYIYY